MNPETFELKGQWENKRGPQYLSYDFWWHLGHDTLITSEWGTPHMVESGVNPELLLAGKYGHALHVWDLHSRHHVQTLDLGAEQQMVLELRPAHNPAETYGFVGVVTSLKDLSASIWTWYREGGNGNGHGRFAKSSRFRRSRRIRTRCHHSSKASAQFRRSSPTSICHSTIECCTSPAGARASCVVTTSLIRSNRHLPVPSGSVESSAERRIRLLRSVR